MKELNQLETPDDCRYAESHEWARIEDGLVVIGITDYAQSRLGDIVFVELPQPGAHLGAGDEFGTVESVKAVSEVYLPVAGTVQDINESLADNPAAVNESPYGDGWMLKVKPDDPASLDKLLDKAGYLATLSGT